MEMSAGPDNKRTRLGGCAPRRSLQIAKTALHVPATDEPARNTEDIESFFEEVMICRQYEDQWRKQRFQAFQGIYSLEPVEALVRDDIRMQSRMISSLGYPPPLGLFLRVGG